LPLGDVAEIDRQPAISGRIEADFKPTVQPFVKLLETDANSFRGRAAHARFGGRAERAGKFLPAALPDQLRSGRAENPLRLLVDVREDPVLVDRHEPVADALEDSGDLAIRALESLVRPAAIRDIPADSRRSDDVSGCVANRG